MTRVLTNTATTIAAVATAEATVPAMAPRLLPTEAAVDAAVDAADDAAEEAADDAEDAEEPPAEEAEEDEEEEDELVSPLRLFVLAELSLLGESNDSSARKFSFETEDVLSLIKSGLSFAKEIRPSLLQSFFDAPSAFMIL